MLKGEGARSTWRRKVQGHDMATGSTKVNVIKSLNRMYPSIVGLPTDNAANDSRDFEDANSDGNSQKKSTSRRENHRNDCIFSSNDFI